MLEHTAVLGAERTTPRVSSGPTTRRSTFDSPRRATISTSSGPFAPSRPVSFVQAAPGSAAHPARAPRQGTLG